MGREKAGMKCVGTVLTEKEYETLRLMIRSADEADQLVAQHLVNGCDIQTSIYWLWRVSKNGAYKMVNLRTKASREFQEACNLFNISSMNEEQFAEWLIKKIG